MMFKSKHSGWTWDLKRTPFGGGNPFSGVTDAISNAIGTSGNGGLVSSISNAIGEGAQTVGDWGVGLDKQVNKISPLGWGLPAMLVAAYLTGGGALAAEGAAEGGAVAAGTAEGATAAGEAAYSEAIAAGATEAEASAAADAAANSYAYGGSTVATETPGASSVLSQPDVAVNLGGNTSGSFGSLNPALPAQGSVGGAGAGMSAQLAPGTVMGNGLTGGGAIGATYAAGANGLPATDFFGNYIPASSINTGGVPSTITGTSYNLDTLKQINQARNGVNTANNLAKMLSQGSMSGLSNSLGKLAQGAHPYGTEQLQIVRGNQNPFTYQAQAPIQDKKPDLSALAELLKQG